MKQTMPDFIGIGAQKSGTSWLNVQLRQHPKIWMPPMKEIHFYDAPKFPMVLLLGSRYPRIRRMMQKNIYKALKKKKDRGWYFRYYFLPRTEAWYGSLFREAHDGQMTGEITPEYALLKKDKIAQIYQKSPKLKIIYLLRNPVDRMLSQLKMEAKRHEDYGLGKWSIEKTEHFLKQNSNMAHSYYLDNIIKWLGCFPPEQFFIGFFDQIKDQPRQFMDDVFYFLGVPKYDIPKDSLTNVIHKGGHLDIPDDIRVAVYKHWHKEVQSLDDYFKNEYTAKWLSDVNAVI